MKAIILAGGIANDLRPITETKPSTLLPILNQTILERMISALPDEIEEVYVAAGFGGRKIQEFIDECKFDIPITVIKEKRPLGTAGAIKSLESFLDDTFLVINADMVTMMQISPMVEAHKDNDATITVALHEHRRPFKFGIFGLDEDDKIIRYMEKPKPDQVFSTLINAGIYVMDPKILELIPGRTFSSLPDLFTRLVRKNAKFYGYIFKEFWAEIGTPQNYLSAHVKLLNRSMLFDINEAKVAKTARLMPPMLLGKKSHISAATLGPEVVTGKNCRIHKNAKLQTSVLMNNVTVGENSIIRNSIIGDNVTVEENCIIEGAVLGDGCTIRKGVKVATRARVWPRRKIRSDVHEKELVGGEL